MIENLGPLQNVPGDLHELIGGHTCVRFEYEHHRPYLKNPEPITLQVVLGLEGTSLQCLIAEQLPKDVDSLEETSRFLNRQPVDLTAPLPLDPGYIPKPWGREIWFSGIEERGVSTCREIPIAWLLDIFGLHLGCTTAPLLLKILDPLPDENFGDLYFELHTQKVEVYVVTHVDRSAWPDGVGRIRYGFDQSLLAEYDSSAAFLGAYRDAVRDYERVRRQIDSGITGLETEERQLRQNMYRFTALQQIRRGDVITVEPLVPHSLQHGVRVIEFQTPHYERYILSFGQQVVTQDHWNTDQALEVARLDGRPFRGDQTNDIIADFDQFRVQRIQIEPGSAVSLGADRYQILIGIEGSLSYGPGTLINPESAWFLPPAGNDVEIYNHTEQPGTFLTATETRLP